MRAIITGATGAIGTALVKELISHNAEVLVLTRKESNRNHLIPKSELVTVQYCSLSELGALNNTTGREWDVMFHLAWEGTTGALRDDVYLQNSNVRYALDAVALAKRFGCRRFIGAGSQAEYGRSDSQLGPDTPAFPETGYGCAKLCAGYMTGMLASQLGLEHIWVRVLSVYGPNDGAQSMVNSTINKLLKGETPSFTKGEQIWDYLYSTDAAEAFYKLAQKGVSGKVYMLASGNPRPLKEYIEIIRSVVAPDAQINLGAVPYSEKQVMHLSANISDLHEDTGWEAATDFEDGIRKIMKERLK